MKSSSFDQSQSIYESPNTFAMDPNHSAYIPGQIYGYRKLEQGLPQCPLLLLIKFKHSLQLLIKFKHFLQLLIQFKHSLQLLIKFKHSLLLQS